MTITIRRADSDDYDDLRDVERAALPTDTPVKDEGELIWWIAKDGDTPVAFAALAPSVQFSGGGYLARAGVIPAYRGRGLQKRLIRVRVAYARRMGWHTVVTDTIPSNPASNNSLIACGFRSYRPERPWTVGGACYWRLKLWPT